MATQSVTSLSSKELIRRLMDGERDFSNTRIADASGIGNEADYPALLAYLKSQDLRTTPIKAEHVDWRGLKAPGLFFEFAVLTGSDLSGSDLSDGSLRRVECTGTSFKGANVSRVTFVAARLGEADFTDAIAQDSDFYESNMTGAKFRNADLLRSYVIRTALKDVDVSGANFAEVCLYRCDLRGAVGLDTTIDLGTAKFYRTIMTAKEQAAVQQAFHRRPSFDVRSE